MFSYFDLHPPLTAFPLVTCTLLCLLELVLLFKPSAQLNFAAKVIAGAFAVSMLFAFISGYQAADLADQTFKIKNELIETHHIVGRTLLFLMPLCIGLKFIAEKATHSVAAFAWTYRALLLVCFSLVLYTGYLGGQLVFEHGAGVRATVAPQAAN